MFPEDFGGKACEGEATEIVTCSLDECPGKEYKMCLLKWLKDKIIFHNATDLKPMILISVCPEEKSSFCSTYVNIMASICDNDWFTNENGRYSCQKSCGMCNFRK